MTREKDIQFLEDARHAARKSKDPSTKCGAVIIRPDRSEVARGYNGFPRKMKDLPEWYLDRGVKLSRVIHAEMNAIMFSNERLDGCTLYTWPFLPCDRCAVHVIQKGIIRVVAPPCPPDKLEKWGAVFELSKAYFQECGVEVLELELSDG